MIKQLLIFCFILVIPIIIDAQIEEPSQFYSGYGGFINYNYNIHSADFKSLPGIPNCCPRFEIGTGSSFSLGAVFEQNLTSILSLKVNAGYYSMNALLKTAEPVDVSVDGNSVTGKFEHTLDASLAMIGIEPLFSFRLLKDLKLNAGFSLGFLMTKKYSQKEEITQPADRGTFLDSNGEDTHQRVRFQSSGDIPNASSLQAGFVVGLSYGLPLNRKGTMMLVPEVYYTYCLTPIVSNYNWNNSSFRAGLSFVYAPNKPEQIIMEKESEEVKLKIYAYENEFEVSGNPNNIAYTSVSKITKKEQEIIDAGITANIKALGITEGEVEYDFNIQVEEFLSTNMKPLLNYVFFDENSSGLPNRYIKLKPEETSGFSENNLINLSTLETYYHVLNIIGRRMLAKPNSKIILIGCNSDKAEEKGNTQLSRKRAESIGKYLSNVWGIKSDRITLKSRSLPENPTLALSGQSPDRREGIEENRRVVIECQDYDIMKPVISLDTLVKVSPQGIIYQPEVFARYPISEWKLVISQQGKLLNVINGKDSIPENINWNINNEKNSIPKLPVPVLYSLEIANTKGNRAETKPGIINVEQQTVLKKKRERAGDRRIDRFSLILFEYNSAELSLENIKISDFIKNHIERNSKVLITGFTDKLGERDYNKQLSKDRANKLGQILEASKPFIRGVGDSEPLYNNELPEGRFYNRTVVVEVETPIKW